MKVPQDAYNDLKGTLWTYKKAGKEVGIDPEKFSDFMKQRFDGAEEKSKEGKDFHLSYTLEWAERLRRGYAYSAADSSTEKALEDAGFSRENAVQ